MDLDLAVNRLKADQSTEERKLMLAIAEGVQDVRDRLAALEQPGTKAGGKQTKRREQTDGEE